MAERRISSRKPVSLPIRLQAKRTVRWAQLLTKNISARGVRCLSHEVLWPVGTLLTFEIPLAEMRAPMTGTATLAYFERVSQSGQYAVGLTFTTLSPTARHDLHLFLKERPKSSE